MTVCREGREFKGDGVVKVTFVEGENGEEGRAIHYLQRLQGFKSIHLMFDESDESRPRARDYIRVEGTHVVTPLSEIVKVTKWEVVPYPEFTQECGFPTVAQAERQRCQCSHH